MEHVDITKVNKWVDKAQVKVILTLRNQDLLDLWREEFIGQISDGMWENSRRTEWIWRNVWVRFGDETKVEVMYASCIGSRSFGMSKFLWDCIGDRLYGENTPFKTEKEARAAWREIATAIYNATETKEARDLCIQLSQEKQRAVADKKVDLLKEWVAAGIDTEHCTGSYWYASHILNKYTTTIKTEGQPDTTVTRTDTCWLYVGEHSDGSISTRVEYNGAKFYIAQGKLAEFLEGLKKFSNTYLNCVKRG